MYKGIQERESICSAFIKNIDKYRNERIALYGIGVNTVYLLENLNDFNIVAVMDQKKEDELFYGLPVISEEEARDMVDVIVIIARNAVLPIIYKRISNLKKDNILIMDVLGNIISSEKINEEVSNNKYWNITYDDLIKSIDKYDIISFDIFDTIIMRKILRPESVFDVIEKDIKCNIIEGFEFKKFRNKAVEMALKEDVNPTIKQIYNCFQKIANIESSMVKKIMDLEIQTEKRFLVPRQSIVDAMKYATKIGKQVYLISDMYLDRSIIKEILDELGINSYDDIFVSCDVKKSKWPNGDIFVYYKERIVKNKSQKLLHIGDNISADIECARAKNIDTFYIMDVYEMLVQSHLSDLLVNVRTLEDEIILGLIIAKVLNNPFALSKFKGKLYINEIGCIGYIGYGPLLVGFTNWLINKYKGKENSNILFLARDGYVLIQVYNRIVKEMGIKEEMPNAIYTLASRRALTVAAIRNEKDLEFAINRIDYKGTCREILKLKFGIDAKKDDKYADEILEMDTFKKQIWMYKDEILANSKEEREEYLKYLEKIGAIGDDKNIIAFDTQTIGTSVYHLEKIVNKPVELVCFVLLNSADYSLHDEIRSYSYLGEDTFYLCQKNFTKSSTLNDSILTSPYPQFIKIDREHQAIYGIKEKSQIYFEKINEVHEGIMNFINDYLELAKYKNEMQYISTNLLDDLNGLIFHKSLIIEII